MLKLPQCQPLARLSRQRNSGNGLRRRIYKDRAVVEHANFVLRLDLVQNVQCPVDFGGFCAMHTCCDDNGGLLVTACPRGYDGSPVNGPAPFGERFSVLAELAQDIFSSKTVV